MTSQIQIRKVQRQIDTENKEIEASFTKEANNKKAVVYKVFQNLAFIYDFIHNMMFLGFNRLWKERLVTLLNPGENTKLVDMAGGTGDMAFRFLDFVEKHKIQNCHVTVCDINEHMLEKGKTGKRASNCDPSLISWVKTDAENSSFQDGSFTAYTIAFGIRNCSDYDEVLRDAFRILQSGGKFFCLESSQPTNLVLSWLRRFLFKVLMLPVVLFAKGDFKAFEYFSDGLIEFPGKEKFKTMIEDAGFKDVTYESYFLGFVALHSATKP